MGSGFFKKSLLVFAVINYQLAFAQTPNQPYKDISIASPTAGSLGKLADIPVSYHTGLPQINVPFYTVKSGPLELPISLSYHASGLKVFEPSGWVGAGFALNAGGVITRSVMGGPDEKATNQAGTETHGHFSDYGYNSYVNNTMGFQDWQGFGEGRKDGEPDLFFFNFAGYSGKFFFSDDRTPVFLPEQDMKIEYSYTTVGSSIESFIMTAPDGTKYFFGRTASTTDVDPIEKTTPYTLNDGLNTGDVISSWFMSKIVSADDQFTINLTYSTENYGYYTISMFPVDGTNPPGSLSPYEYGVVKNIVQGVRLSQISFPNGTVDFTATTVRTDLSDDAANILDAVNTQARALDAISISNANGFCKRFNFSYNYFVDNSSVLPGFLPTIYTLQTDKKRLKLESVGERSCDATIINPPHSFSYFSEFVPRRLSFGIDHWGFYNGVNNNPRLIPTFTRKQANAIQTISGANRDASWPAMRCGTVEKITYPTGGTTTMEFEPHSVYTQTTSYTLAPVAELVVHQFGQSQITHTVSFTSSGPEIIQVVVHNNSSNWSPTLVIKNSSNVEVYNSLTVSTTVTHNINLPAGNYQATLSFPSNSMPGLINGADATVSQWSYLAIPITTIIGGLRISKMTHDDGGIPNKTVVTNYSYVAGGQSSAELFSRPVYVQTIRNDLIRDVGYWTTDGFTPYTYGLGCLGIYGGEYYKSPSSIRPMATTQGSHVGYRTVKVSQTDNGYSLFEYYGLSPWPAAPNDIAVRFIDTDFCDGNAPNFPAAPLPHDFMRGELKDEWHYNEQGTLLKRRTYVPVYQQSTFSTPGFIVAKRANQYLGTNYSISTAKKIQSTITETNFTANGSSTKTEVSYFESLFHAQRTRSTTTNSTGQTLEMKSKYAADFAAPACIAVSDCSAAYATAMSTAQTTYNTQRTACGSSSSCLTTAYLTYLQNQSNARVSYINCRRTNFTNTTNAYKTAHDIAKSTANTELKPLFELQDQFNNAMIESTAWRGGNLVGATYTKFGYSTNPATKVYPSVVQTINISNPSATYTNSAVSTNSITKDARYIDETTLKYYLGNLVELKKSDGIYNSYIWGYNNTLPIVKSAGVDFTTLLAAYNSVSGNLSTLRSQPPLSSALLNTYVYSTLVGITTETNPNGRNTNYSYDAIARLKLIKDHDNNIIKRICYNYSGQTENCGPNPVTVTLQNAFPGSGSYPASVLVEFVQGGTVVQTSNFPATRTGTVNVNLPAGIYTIRFTMPSGFSTYGINYHLNTPSTDWTNFGSGLLLITGNVTFSSGTTYNITATVEN